MKIHFLGTGSGKTSLKRYHSSFLILTNEVNLLVDCGDGISRSVLSQNISFNSIDYILISHYHPDHFAGLPSLITQMKLAKRTNKLIVFTHSQFVKFTEDLLFCSYLFKEKLGFDLQIVGIDVNKEIKINDSFSFSSKENTHLHKYLNYNFEKNISLISLSFLFKEKDFICIYSGDVGSPDDLNLFNQKADWFISDSTHLDFNSLVAILKFNWTQKLIITHIEDEAENLLVKSIDLLENRLKSNIIIAHDGYILDHSS